MKIEAKICSMCHHRNPVTSMECESCGFDLTFVFPEEIDDNDKAGIDEQKTTAPNTRGWCLFASNNIALRVYDLEEKIIGRDEPECKKLFGTSNYVSRQHAKLRVLDGQLQVLDASTNGTFINERRIPKLEWTDVPEGALLRFADIELTIKRHENGD